jgi:F0F1-type ATP synthase membrane subunit b/b'
MLPQLDTSVYFSQLFWLFICVFALIVIFKKFFIPRIDGLISKRNSIITEKENNIKKLKLEIRKIETDIETLKNEGLARSSKIMQNAVEKSEMHFKEQLQIAKNKNATSVSGMKENFNEELANLGQAFEVQIENISQFAVERIFLQKK